MINAGKVMLSETRARLYDPDGLELTVEKVENTWLPYEDLNFRSVWGRECLWRICLRVRADKKTVTITVR